MYANPNTILLLDEPDAHLEVIRQREAFQKINAVAAETNSQVLIASHSEVVLDEAAEASKVIALIENQAYEFNTSTKTQSIKYIKKALSEIGWEKYYLARLKGHVLYVEGSTDLQMLLAFAGKLKHPVEPLLRVANVAYTADNVPNTAIKNFVALKEIFPTLKGLALFDKLLSHQYTQHTSKYLEETMKQTIADYTQPAYLKDPNNSWWDDAKLSDEWLDKIFPLFYKQLDIPFNFFKRDYHQLINLMNPKDISDEVTSKLDRIELLLR